MKSVTVTETIGYLSSDHGGGLFIEEVGPVDGMLGHRESRSLDVEEIAGADVIQCGNAKAYGRIRVTVEWEPLEDGAS